MNQAQEQRQMNIVVQDPLKQRSVKVKHLDADLTGAELIGALVRQLDLPANDSQSRPLSYQARIEAQGRLLSPTERVGDALTEDEILTLQPTVHAGRA